MMVLAKILPDWLVHLNPKLLSYTTINFLILTVFYAARSRGALVFFIAVFLLYLFVLGKDRVAVALYMLIMSALAYPVAENFLNCMVEKKISFAILWVIAGLILALAVQILYILYGKYLDKLRIAKKGNRKYFFVIITLTVIVSSLILIQYGYAGRFTSFSYLRNALERIYFVNDAIKMIKQRPLLGWGGGGWEEAYHSVQEYLYISTQVHSYYVQVVVETGILGVLNLLGILGCFLMLVFNLYLDNKEKPKLHAIVTLVAMVLFITGHAIMDFNLSLSALTILLWTLFGLLVGMFRISSISFAETQVKNTLLNKGYLYISMLIAGIIFVADIYLLLASNNYQLADDSFSQKNTTTALTYMEHASQQNPFSPDYKLTLSQIYRNNGQKEKALTEVKKVLELSKYNPLMCVEASKVYFSLGDTKTAVELAEKAVQLGPYIINGYDNLLNIYFKIAYNGLVSENKDLAMQYFNKINSVSSNIQTRVNILTDYQCRMWRDGPMLALTTNMSYKTGAARYFLGQYKEAQENLNFAATDEKLKANVPLWRALVAQKLGDPVKAQEFLLVGEKNNEKIREQFAGISNYKIK